MRTDPKRFDILDTSAPEHFKVAQCNTQEEADAWCFAKEPFPTGLDGGWRYIIQPIFVMQK